MDKFVVQCSNQEVLIDCDQLTGMFQAEDTALLPVGPKFFKLQCIAPFYHGVLAVIFVMQIYFTNLELPGNCAVLSLTLILLTWRIG